MLVNTVVMFFLTLNATVVHFKNAFSNKYEFYQVEDVVHFLVVIDIVTISSSLVVIICVLFFASIFN